jgi:hypothetical protein
MTQRALLLAAASLLLAGPGTGQEQQAITVELRDGTRVPLLSWGLGYEYVTWAKGSSAALAAPQERQIDEIYVGKKSYPAAGQLAFEYGMVRRARFVDTETKTVEVLQPVRFTVTEPGGKSHEFKKPEAPHKDRVAPDAGKDYLYQARSFFVSGQTLTGTRRRYCLFTYTSLSECSDDPALQVVRIEFP